MNNRGGMIRHPPINTIFTFPVILLLLYRVQVNAINPAAPSVALTSCNEVPTLYIARLSAELAFAHKMWYPFSGVMPNSSNSAIFLVKTSAEHGRSASRRCCIMFLFGLDWPGLQGLRESFSFFFFCILISNLVP